MKKVITAFTATAAISTYGLANDASADTGNGAYSVIGGDTLWKIAQENNLTVNQLKNYNNLSSDTITVGQNINFDSPSTYTVKAGDTLWGIGNRNNVSVAQLKEWNNLESDLILVNQTLNIKGAVEEVEEAPVEEEEEAAEVEPAEEEAVQTDADTYTVKAGDTLYSIAGEFGTSYRALMDINGLSDFLIFPGQVLQLNGEAAEVEVEEIVEEEPVEEEVVEEEPAEEEVVDEEPVEEEVVEEEPVEEEVVDEEPVEEEVVEEEVVDEEPVEEEVVEEEPVEEEVVDEAPVEEEVVEEEPVEEEVVDEEPVEEEVVEEEPVEEEVGEEEPVEEEVVEEAPVEEEVVEEAPVEEEVVEEEEPEPENITDDTYTVQSGDTLASIAKRAGISYNNIMEYNEMDSVLIYPGKVLDLVDNRPAEVEEPEVVEESAAPAQEETVEVEAVEEVEPEPEPAPEPVVEEVVEEEPEPVVEEEPEPAAEEQAPAAPAASYGTNWYPSGECTWYAFERRQQLGKPVSGSWGNASSWAGNARAQGLSVSNTPSHGAIIQSNAWSNGAWGSGHVGVVEQVNGDGSIMISEMNWNNGLGGKSFRTLSASEAANHNFIH